MQRVLNKILKWRKTSGFDFSASKTKLLHIFRSKSRKKFHFDPSLKMCDQPIQVVQELSILGVIFDKRLNWTSHLKMIKARAQCRLNVMKAISGPKGGADEKILLMLHESTVLSTLEYGSEVYSSATNSQLKKLNSVHHTGLRTATGTFRTTPTESLYTIAGKGSLSDRRNQKSFALGLKIGTIPNHLIKIRTSNAVNSFPNSFVNRFYKLLEHWGLNLKTIMLIQRSQFPPWTLKVNSDATLTKWTKSDTLPTVFRSGFNELMAQYQS